MSDIAIRVNNLSKQYRIGASQGKFKYKSLRDSVSDVMLAPIRRAGKLLRGESTGASGLDETFWALKDVSFEIKQGEAVGIIGRNGAGKSTLLKILSEITEPTEGTVELHGRVGSLLEVGTGFHPELTGRDNIYLNGAILGMKRAEIDRKFDEIVAFAEVEKFIDTPVKHYSSGMYMRLAFAVAAHLETEILLVDEVLAVGDTQFQKKCLGKMGAVAQEGRTVLFVSHNMGAIAQLCQNVILLNKGMLEIFSNTAGVVKQYLSGGIDNPNVYFDPSLKPKTTALITRLWLGDITGQSIPSVDINEPFTIGMEILVRRNTSNVEISVRVSNNLGQPLFTTNLSDASGSTTAWPIGCFRYLVPFPAHFMAPNTYSIDVAIHEPSIEIIDQHEHAMSFELKETGSLMWRYNKLGYGNILVNFSWQNIS